MTAFDPEQKSQTKTVRTLTGHQPTNPGIEFESLGLATTSFGPSDGHISW